MKVMITGTRHAIGQNQKENLCCFLGTYSEAITEFHHGCCTGGDEYGAVQADHTLSKAAIFAHPGPVSNWHSFAAMGISTSVFPRKPFLVRNVTMAKLCQVCIAFPLKEEKDDVRSGTWHAIRQVRKLRKPCLVFLPHTEVTDDFPEVEKWLKDKAQSEAPKARK